MVKIGTQLNSRAQQRINAELETIIEDFGRAMRDAFRPYIANSEPACQHAPEFAFTPHMKEVWNRYVAWCQQHG